MPIFGFTTGAGGGGGGGNPHAPPNVGGLANGLAQTIANAYAGPDGSTDPAMMAPSYYMPFSPYDTSSPSIVPTGGSSVYDPNSGLGGVGGAGVDTGNSPGSTTGSVGGSGAGNAPVGSPGDPSAGISNANNQFITIPGFGQWDASMPKLTGTDPSALLYDLFQQQGLSQQSPYWAMANSFSPYLNPLYLASLGGTTPQDAARIGPAGTLGFFAQMYQNLMTPGNFINPGQVYSEVANASPNSLLAAFLSLGKQIQGQQGGVSGMDALSQVKMAQNLLGGANAAGLNPYVASAADAMLGALGQQYSHDVLTHQTGIPYYQWLSQQPQFQYLSNMSGPSGVGGGGQ